MQAFVLALLLVGGCEAAFQLPRRVMSKRPPLRASAAPPPPLPAPEARPLLAASLALTLVNGGVIFGWPGLVGLLQQRGVVLTAAEWARMYTIGTVAFSGSAPIAGTVVDQLGPRRASALAGFLCVSGLAALALRTDAFGLMAGYAALSVGGFSAYLASLALGNAKPSRWHAPLLPPIDGSRAITYLSCLVDVSAISFVAMHAAQRRLAGCAWLSTRAIFGGMALATVLCHLTLWRYWGLVMVRSGAPGAAIASGGIAKGRAPAQPLADTRAESAVWPQLRSVHFVTILLFAAVHSLSSGHALAHLPAHVGLGVAGGMRGAEIAELASVLMTVGCLPCIPLVSACLDLGLGAAMGCVNLLGLAYLALSLLPGTALQLLSALVFAAYRGLLYSYINLFHQAMFGPRVMGRTIGAMALLSSLPLFLLQQPLFAGGAQFARAQRSLGALVLALSACTSVYTARNRQRLDANSGAAAAA
jgi:hypothetical protein